MSGVNNSTVKALRVCKQLLNRQDFIHLRVVSSKLGIQLEFIHARDLPNKWLLRIIGSVPFYWFFRRAFLYPYNLVCSFILNNYLYVFFQLYWASFCISKNCKTNSFYFYTWWAILLANKTKSEHFGLSPLFLTALQM